ncbi:hypothetical protein ACP4OV_015373 [Aristida adscensionis]
MEQAMADLRLGGFEFFKILLPGMSKSELLVSALLLRAGFDRLSIAHDRGELVTVDAVLRACVHMQRLPARFAAELGARRRVKLRLDGGGGRGTAVREAEVVASGGNTYLGRGWRQFARAHELRDGYLLVFHYDGAGVLTVTVFDRSTCCRDYPRAAAAARPRRTRSARGVVVDEEAPAGGGAGAGGASPGAAGADESQFAVTLRQVHLGERTKQYLVSRRRRGRQRVTLCRRRVVGSLTRVSRRTGGAAARRGAWLQNVPVYFQDAHGYARRRQVVLRMGAARSWAVNLKHGRRANGGDRTAFKYGWRQFCVDNGLDVGDVCFFRAHGDGEDGDHVLRVEVRKTDGTLLV